MERNKIFDGGFYRTRGHHRFLYNGNVELLLRYDDYSGKVCNKSFTASSLEKCYDRAAEFYYDYKGFLCRPDSTVPEILERKFENDYKMNFIKEQTYYGKLSMIGLIRKHPIGQIPAADVSEELIEMFLESIVGYSPGTIEMYFIFLRTAFRIAESEGIIPKDLMKSRDIRRPHSKKSARKVQALSVEEQRLVLKDLTMRKPNYGANDFRSQLMIQLYSGMRIGEVNALTPDDIDFNYNVIHVRNTVIGVNGAFKIGDTTKTFSGYRDVPIAEKLKPILQKAVSEMKENELNLIFYDCKRKCPFASYMPSSYFSRVCRRVGISPRGSHALRHTYATRCIEAGVPAVVLKKWLGHTDIHVTLDTYADVFDRMNNSAVSKLDKHLESIEESI